MAMEAEGERLQYETVAAGQTAQVLGGNGAVGDYLSHVVFQPAAVGAATSTIIDGTTVVYTVTGGTLSDLRSIIIPVGARSLNGPWKITTGANMAALACGKFTT
jgi:hypothetical protein